METCVSLLVRLLPSCFGVGRDFFPSARDATIGVFTLVTRGWVESEFLMRASKVNMTPNGEHQIIGLDRSQTF